MEFVRSPFIAARFSLSIRSPFGNRASIVSLRDHIVQQSSLEPSSDGAGGSTLSPGEKLSLGEKLSREAYVFGGGMWDGIKANGKHAIENPEQSAPAFLLSAGIGAAMAYANKRAGLIKLAARVAGVAFTVGFVKDLLDPERLSGIGNAASDTWNGRGTLAENRAAINHHGGQFAFDVAFMGAGGMMGAGAVSFGRAKGWSPSLISERLGFGKPAEALLPVPVHARVHSRSLGAISEKVQRFDKGRSLPSTEFFPNEGLTPSLRSRMLRTDGTGKPKPLSEQESIVWKRDDGKVLEWKPTDESVQVRREAETFVKQLMAKDYKGATQTALSTEAMRGVELNPHSRKHEVNIGAAEILDNEHLGSHMKSLSELAIFKWHQVIKDSEIGMEQLSVVVPRPIIKLKNGEAHVPFVDFVKQQDRTFTLEFPTTTTSGKPLTAAQTAEITTIRNSPEGQRLLGEVALFAFEESLVHANQHRTSGGRIMSPTFAEFSRDFSQTHGTRGHMLAFLGMMDRFHPLREALFEQEVPAILYDAGMPLSMIKHHFFFGGRHTVERAPVIKFLEAREAVTK